MSILLDHPVEGHSPSILVPYESWIYLRQTQSLQRSGRGLTEGYKARAKRGFDTDDSSWGVYHHMHQLLNGDLGGAYEGHWTNWTIEQMKAMLDEAGLPYEDGGEVEYIDV